MINLFKFTTTPLLDHYRRPYQCGKLLNFCLKSTPLKNKGHRLRGYKVFLNSGKTNGFCKTVTNWHPSRGYFRYTCLC